MTTCESCGHEHAGPNFGGICIGCPCPEVPAHEAPSVLYACCKCCDGNAVCSARPDRHEFACTTVDAADRFTCPAVEVPADA